MFKNSPLAYLLRPNSIEEIIGQSHLINNEGLIVKMIKKQQVFNLIFYGYPGIGKTSLAIALANDLKLQWSIFNASIDKKEKLLEIIKIAKKTKEKYVLIIEEIHRLNKDKQDILLSLLEDGSITLFASTTENPYFTINPAVRSRCHILQLEIPNNNDILIGLKKIIQNNNINIKISDKILEIIISINNGDIRGCLNIIDILVKLYDGIEITNEIIANIMPKANLLASSYGDEYYDIQSAFHKSMRGSDCDAAIYYLARLIETGDFKSIYRRILACCYEDVGLANVQLCNRVSNAIQSCEILGFPENKQVLSTIVIQICLSPKSNSAYKAIVNALSDIKEGKSYSIPKHLKDQSYNSSSKLGNVGYKYPHDYNNSWINQDYLPKELKNKKYYIKNKNLSEEKLNNILEIIKKTNL